MNRIILIGNGFDLAHGMQTGYKDFINSYWKKIISELKEDETRVGFCVHPIIELEACHGIIDIKCGGPFNSYRDLIDSNNIGDIDFKNKFFEIITKKNDLMPKETLFLNFNYTSTEEDYLNYQSSNWFKYGKIESVKSLHIHGTLKKDENNPIIFGYGDEMDDDYKAIEKLKNNEYLENIKSINYLETNNYRKLLEFIESGIFQVFTLGHSCGTSDRTLLNTIFEHDNCASIKVFYHQKSKKEDNYSDVSRNISRNFDNNKKMRARVVPKTSCEPLISNQYPETIT